MLSFTAWSARAATPPNGVRAGSPVIPAGVDAGAVLLGELNCIACHAAEEAIVRRLQSKQPPRLDKLGARVTADYLRAFLRRPHKEKPGTTMPDLLGGLGEREKIETIDAVVHFLVSLAGDARPRPEGADAVILEMGRKLYHEIGCVACHDPQDPPSRFDPLAMTTDDDADGDRPGPTAIKHPSVPLGNLAAKTTVNPLTQFLADPLATRPSGRMPSMNLSATEARAIAVYLLRDQIPKTIPASTMKTSGLKYGYYEIESPRELPDFVVLDPTEIGIVETFTITPARRETRFAFKFTGLVTVPADGTYTFFTTSNDGSRLYINGKLVVDNDELHGAVEKSGQVVLQAGTHPITVTHFQEGGASELKVSYAGPGIKKQLIPNSALSHWATIMRPVGGDESLVVDPAKAARGRSLFASLGCAACHPVADGADSIASELKAPPLLRLDPDHNAGCIGRQVARGRPTFQLTADQRAALRRTLASAENLSTPLDAKSAVAHTLTVMNCYACHARDGTGGPEAGRAAYFSVVGGADLGEEGRLPPPLTGVGNKLKTSWLGDVLTEGRASRPYMVTRMPQFGVDNIGHLVKMFEHADAVDVDETLPDDRQQLAPFGRKLVGTKGLSCVACHTFAQYKSLGMPALNLIDTTRRIRKGWFRRYLVDPQSLRPGTRMPEFWPGGKSVRDDIFDGDTDRQIDAIWCFLSDGDRAKTPDGLVQGKMEIVPASEAIMYRGFIQGAGMRGIGVGYPEKVNLAFDADHQRLAVIWLGPFLDVAQHRTGRASGFVPPLGDRVIALPNGAPLAVLESLDHEWPSAVGKAGGFRMRGYRLDAKRRPTFLFSYRDIEVEDFTVAVETELDPMFLRTLTLGAERSVENLWFRAAVGQTIKKRSGGTYRIDGKLTLRFPSTEPDAPVVRERNGKRELLVPVRFRDGQATLVEELVW